MWTDERKYRQSTQIIQFHVMFCDYYYFLGGWCDTFLHKVFLMLFKLTEVSIGSLAEEVIGKSFQIFYKGIQSEVYVWFVLLSVCTCVLPATQDAAAANKQQLHYRVCVQICICVFFCLLLLLFLSSVSTEYALRAGET